MNLSDYRKAKKFLKIVERAYLFESHYMALANPKKIEREKEKHELDRRKHGGKDYCLIYSKKYLKHISGISYFMRKINDSSVFRYKVVNSVIDRFFLGDEYPDSYHLLVNRQTEFQKLLDSHPSYVEALRKFRRKTIGTYYGCGYEARELGLLPLEVLLDKLAAVSIDRWCQIRRDGIEMYRELPAVELKKISEKARDLLDAIEHSSYPVKKGINERFMKTLAGLSQGETKAAYLGRSKSLKTAHIQEPRYRVGKRHQKAMREVLIREISSAYMWTFGRFSLDRNYMGKISDMVCIGRKFTDKRDEFKGGVWVPREKPIIHADVIINLLGIIDDLSGDDISERKIQEIASKQRDRDLELKSPMAARL